MKQEIHFTVLHFPNGGLDKNWNKLPDGTYTCFDPICPFGKSAGVGDHVCGKCSKQISRHPDGNCGLNEYKSYIVCGANSVDACTKLFNAVQNKDKTKFVKTEVEKMGESV